LQIHDPRNTNILIHVNGELVTRENARISVFDSVVQGGDAVWEGLRVYKGRIAALGDHLERLRNSAKALAFESIPDTDDIRLAIFETLEANGMSDETHIRLTLTRGEKVTSGMNPRLNQSGCSLIVLAEWKPPVYSDEGIFCNSPQHAAMPGFENSPQQSVKQYSCCNRCQRRRR